MSGETVLTAIEAACQALNHLGLQFALVGGAALPAWGRVRATGDADFLVALPQPESSTLSAVIERFRTNGFAHHNRADRKRIDEHLILHFWFPIRPQAVSIRVDLLFSEDSIYRQMLDRATERRIDGFVVPIASCEDLILLKLRAARPIDNADAAALIAGNRDNLDADYLQRRAAELGVQEALARAWEEAG